MKAFIPFFSQMKQQRHKTQLGASETQKQKVLGTTSKTLTTAGVTQVGFRLMHPVVCLEFEFKVVSFSCSFE